MSVTAHNEILRSTVRLARLSFTAAASSVFLYDREHDTLVFEASSGPGEDRLIGVAIPSDRGLAGWVANTGEPIVIRGVSEDARFDRDFATETGLLPDVIMAAPVEHDGEVLGVLEVLDPRMDRFGDLAAIDLLTELANQSSAALSLLIADRRAKARQTDLTGPLAKLGVILEHADADREAAITQLIDALAKLLR